MTGFDETFLFTEEETPGIWGIHPVFVSLSKFPTDWDAVVVPFLSAAPIPSWAEKGDLGE